MTSHGIDTLEKNFRDFPHTSIYPCISIISHYSPTLPRNPLDTHSLRKTSSNFCFLFGQLVLEKNVKMTLFLEDGVTLLYIKTLYGKFD